MSVLSFIVDEHIPRKVTVKYVVRKLIASRRSCSTDCASLDREPPSVSNETSLVSPLRGGRSEQCQILDAPGSEEAVNSSTERETKDAFSEANESPTATTHVALQQLPLDSTSTAPLDISTTSTIEVDYDELYATDSIPQGMGWDQGHTMVLDEHDNAHCVGTCGGSIPRLSSSVV